MAINRPGRRSEWRIRSCAECGFTRCDCSGRAFPVATHLYNKLGTLAARPPPAPVDRTRSKSPARRLSRSRSPTRLSMHSQPGGHDVASVISVPFEGSASMSASQELPYWARHESPKVLAPTLCTLPCFLTIYCCCRSEHSVMRSFLVAHPRQPSTACCHPPTTKSCDLCSFTTARTG